MGKCSAKFSSIRVTSLSVFFGLFAFVPIRIDEWTSATLVYLILICLMVIFLFISSSLRIPYYFVLTLIFLIVQTLLGLLYYPVNDVLLSALPFLGFLLYPLFSSALSSDKVALKMQLIPLVVLSIAYTIRFYITMAQMPSVAARITWFNFDTVLSLNAVGVIICLSYLLFNQKSAIKNVIGSIVMLIVIIPVLLTYSRSIYLCLLVVAFSFFLALSMLNKFRVGIAVVVFLIALALSFKEQTKLLFDFAEERFSTVSDVSRGGDNETRYQEVVGGFTAFLESPIVGKGFGYKLEIYRYGNWVKKRYIHNGGVYLLMSVGLIGFGIFFIFPIICLCKLLLIAANIHSNSFAKKQKLTIYATFGILLYFILFSQFFAAFRLPHFTVVLAYILAISNDIITRFSLKRD